MKRLLRNLLPACAALALLLTGQQLSAAPPTKVVVESASPSTGEQGTTELDVVITGSGFDSSAAVTFLVSGSTTDTGDVVVQSVTYHDAKKLTARVSLSNAKLADFDVMVRLTSGRNGKGITLFKVVAKGGGSADSTAPGAIQGLTAVSATRAITLRFVAPGDDGMSGRAAGYDVYYSAGSSCQAIGTPPSGGSWVLAPRSSETTAELSGAVDFFNVHAGESGDGDGLAAGTPYCVAIRARDEVPNGGPWSFIDKTTLGTLGDWVLTPRFGLTDGTRATAVNFDYPTPLGDAVLGWVVTEPTGMNDRTRMQFASPAWGVNPVEVSAAPIFRVDNFRMIANPGTGRVGAVVGGRRDTEPYGNFHLFVEVGPTGPLPVEIAVTGIEGPGGIAPPGGGMTYVRRDDGVWNPVIAFERIVAKTVAKGKVTWSTQLAVKERVSGQWGPDQITGISRTDAVLPFFRGAQLFTKPDGTTLGLLVSHCDVLIYGERANGVWKYWDAGPAPGQKSFESVPNHAILAIGFSDGAAPAPVIARRTAYNGMLQITHPLTGAVEWTPTSTCANAVSKKPNAWENVAMAPEADVTHIGVTAVAEVQGSVFLAMNAYHGVGKTADQRVVYRCAGSPDWQVASIDRTNGMVPTAAFGPVVVDGHIRRAYAWNWPGSNNINPLDPPDDFVVLASQPVASLCP